MIGIRTITYHLPNAYNDKETLRRVQHCARVWESCHEGIHTQRLCLPAFQHPVPLNVFDDVLDSCEISPIRWVNIPFVWTAESNESKIRKFILDALGYSGRIFSNVIAMEESTLHTDALRCYSHLIHKVSKLDYSGSSNFRLGVSFNIGYNCPFFPFTRSDGKELSFSIGLEMVSGLNRLISEAPFESSQKLQEKVLRGLNKQIDELAQTAQRVSEKTKIPFGGFDFSLAPEMNNTGSVVPLLNALGVYNFGQSGTMFATAFWTDILKKLASDYPSVGFSGVMYSLLEDRDLCAINNERGIDINQLISLSTMCGCGLDMIPISGDVGANEVYSLCLDIAAISCRLNKPLGIRLLPIPGTKRGQRSLTHISGEADFIYNTRIVPLDVNVMNDVGKQFNFVKYGK